jgi:hypothetical protein
MEARCIPVSSARMQNKEHGSMVLPIIAAGRQKECWVSLGVSLLMLNWYLCVRNTNCPKTPISRPEEKRGDPRATIPLTSSNYSEGPVSTQFLLCDGMLTQVPIL